MSAGFVYVLSNPSLRDRNGAPIFKVGGTSRTPLQRAAELSASSSIAERFSVSFEARCQDWKAVECAVHLSLHRCRLRGEFFCAPLQTITAAICHALTHLEPAGETVEPIVGREAGRSSAMPSILELQFGTGTTAQIYWFGDMVSFSSRYGTITLDLPPVPRRVRADRARRIRNYIQRSAAEQLFQEVRPVLEPDVTLLPDDEAAGTYTLTINGEPAFRITIGERTRWWSRHKVRVSAQALPGFCGDKLLPSELTRTGAERDAVLEEVTDGAVRAYVQHAMGRLENSPPFWPTS